MLKPNFEEADGLGITYIGGFQLKHVHKSGT